MSIDRERVFVQSTLPRAWEEPDSFQDALYDWMSRAPCLAISAALHLVIFLIVQAIPWGLLFQGEEKVIQVTSPLAPEELFEPPPPEQEQEIDEQETEEVPELQAAELDEVDTPVDDVLQHEGEPENLLDSSPFHDENVSDVLGISGGWRGGKYGDRFGNGPGTRGGGRGTEIVLKAGLEWLAQHQSPDGSWDSDGFAAECGKIGAGVCDGPGQPLHDVGLTGLALLAFLGDGNTLSQGAHRHGVGRAVQWLRRQQDPDTGLLGEATGHGFLYDHAIATLALCETYYFSRSALLRRNCQSAVNLILRARNPYGAWRYDLPPVGDEDTSVTGWMVLALKSAEDAGLAVEPDAFAGALQWFDEVTDPGNGRVGYDSMGSKSSRVAGINDHFPPEKGEAMTAVALLCRFFLGQDPRTEPTMVRHADLLAKTLPEWDPAGFGCDMYYWYYGSYAMYQMGGRHWSAWKSAMEKAVLGSQRRDGDLRGSWDPLGPWGYSGGRVYSTALMVLCLEVYFRYAQVLGAR